MTLEFSVVTCLVIFILLLGLLTSCGYTLLAATVLAGAITNVTLISIYSPSEINPWLESEAITLIYSLIVVGVPVFILFYGIFRAACLN